MPVAELRKTGIEIIGDAPWGTHFCQFYKTKQDLIDLLVPYFARGLEQNEFCLWVTSEPFRAEEAAAAIREALPGFERYLSKGQIEIIPYTDWYYQDGVFDADRALNGWVDKLDQALARGFEGLRLSGNTFWLETQEWRAFTDYEQKVNSVIGRYRMMALCTYSLERCGASEVIDVVSNHQFALIKRRNQWTRIESAEQRRTEETLRQLTEELEARVQARTEELQRSNDQLRGAIAERERADERLGEEKRFVDTILTSLPGIFYLLDERGGFLRWNQTFETVSGYSAQEFARLHALDLFDGADKTRIDEKIQEVFGKGRAMAEAQLTSKDGRRTPFLFTGVRLTLENRRYLVGMGIDITERKAAERQLLQQQIEQQTLLDLVPAMVWYKDTHNRFLRVNRAAAEAAHKKIEDIEGKSAHEIYPEEAEGYYRDDLEVIASGKPKLGIIELLQTGSGEKRWIQTDKVPYRDDQGRIVGVLVFAQDITERKQAEEEHSRLAAIVASSSDAIIGKTLDGIVTSWNQGATRLYGYRADDILGRSVTLLFPADRRGEERRIMDQITRGERVQPYETVRLRKDGSPIEVSVTTSPIRDAAGQVIGASTIARDVTERRKQEQEQRWLASFPALNPTLIVEVDAAGAVTYANSSALKPHPDLATLGAVHPLLDGAVELLARLKRESAGTEIREIRVGERVYVQYCTPAQDYARLRFYSIDITERKRAEQALRQQTRLLELFFQYTQTSIVFLDRDFNFIRVNDAYAKACRRAVSDFPGHNHFEFYPSDTQQIFEQVRETKRPYEALARPFVFPDHPEWGVTYWDWTLVPILDASGKIELFVFALDDVTDRKRAEDALRKASIYNRSLIEASLDPLVTIGPDGTITDVNAATEAATGCSRQELIGTDFARYFTEPERARTGYGQVFREGLVRDYELEIRHREGTTRAVLYNASLYRDESGQAIGVFAAARDITERKQMERHAQRIEQLASMGQLLGGVVHELKNPLFIVTGRLQLLKEKLANREYDGLEPDLLKIEEAAQRMGGIAQRFLTLARPTHPTLQICSVAAILKGVLDFLSNELMKANVRVTTDYAANLPPCLSDPAQLHQAFLNLVMNAVQAMAKAHGQGTLTVKAELSAVSAQPSAPAERWIEVRIQDDGPGIPPEHRARLFEPFFTTKPLGEGTGLGLWTVQVIVSTLKGTVAVETDVGHGTTFIVRLPVAGALTH